MNNLRLIRPAKVKGHLTICARYGKPLNRWQWHYANEDGIFEQDFNWIEMKTMPQPFPEHHFIFSHKEFPKSYHPYHMNDVRYNFQSHYWPRRHFVPDFLFRQYNFNDADQIMHGLQWTDFEIDYQLADPMESNHYIQGRSPSFVVFCGVVLFVFVIIYPLWGYGTIEAFEEPYKLRKMFQFPDASLVFTWVASFTGNNYGTFETMEEKQRSGARLDKEGNILPNHIRKYHFEDEYTYRI